MVFTHVGYEFAVYCMCICVLSLAFDPVLNRACAINSILISRFKFLIKNYTRLVMNHLVVGLRL